MRIAVFASGNGTNFQALVDAQSGAGLSNGTIVLLVCDNPDAHAIERAKKAGIEVFLLESEGFSSRHDYDKVILNKLEEENIELILLAGFMRIFSSTFFDSKYKDRIINVHPSLLPKFKGAHAIRDAYEGGEKETGVTIHFVIEELDAGPVIMQEKVTIEKEDTLESLEEKIHRVEHRVYTEAVRNFIEGKIKMEG